MSLINKHLSSTELFFVLRNANSSFFMSGLAVFSADIPFFHLESKMKTGYKKLISQSPFLCRAIKNYCWVNHIPSEFKVTTYNSTQNSWSEVISNILSEDQDALILPILIEDLDKKHHLFTFKMHHALGDGITFASVFSNQIKSSFVESIDLHTSEAKQHQGKCLKKYNSWHFNSVTDSVYSDFPGTTTHKGSVFLKTGLNNKKNQEYTPFDILAWVLMEALFDFNKFFRNSSTRIGLLIPHNNRINFYEGYGQKTTRIRIFRNYKNKDILSQIKEIREQLRESRQNQEWAIPEYLFLKYLPKWLLKIFFNYFSNSNRFELGTSLFTFMDYPELKKLNPTITTSLQQVYGITPVTQRHPITFCAMTFQDEIFLSINYDSGRIKKDKIDALKNSISSYLCKINFCQN